MDFSSFYDNVLLILEDRCNYSINQFHSMHIFCKLLCLISEARKTFSSCYVLNVQHSHPSLDHVVTSGQHTAHTDTQHTHIHPVTQTLTTIKASCPFNIHSLHIHRFLTSHYLSHFSWSFFFAQFFKNKFWVSSSNYHLQTGHFFVHIPWKQMWLGYMYMCIYTNRTVFWVVYQCAISIYSCKQSHISLLIIFSIQQNKFSMVWWIKTLSTNI